jgi:conjugative transfer pilus assembly protein TraH
MQKYVLGLIAILFTALPVQAEDWVDDWFNQSTYSRPNTYNTQKRGYVTGGRLSLRMNPSNDHLVSISLPTFKKGCGGIDLFNGSMSFLSDEDRLVGKFRNIMSEAMIAYAWDLIMNVECEMCAKSYKALTAVADRLNQLQIDDCKAGQAVYAILKDSSGKGDSQENTEAITDFLLTREENAVSDYASMKEMGNNRSTQAVMNQNGISKHDLVSGCPDGLKNIFFSEGSLLENLASEIGTDPAKVQFMRAIVGDIYISDALEYGAVAPCPQNQPTNLDNIIYGDFYVRRNGQCVHDQVNIGGIMYPSIFEWAKQNMLEVAEALVNREPLSSANELFINTIPDPVLIQISAEIAMQGNDFEADQTAERHAHAASVIFAKRLMSDLYDDLHRMLYYAEVTAFNQTAGGRTCAVGLSNKAQDMARDMRTRVMDYASAINQEYQAAIAEVLQTTEYVKLTQEGSEEAEVIPMKKVAE